MAPGAAVVPLEVRCALVCCQRQDGEVLVPAEAADLPDLFKTSYLSEGRDEFPFSKEVFIALCGRLCGSCVLPYTGCPFSFTPCPPTKISSAIAECMS